MKRADDFLQIYGSFSISDKLENHHTGDLALKAKRFINLLSDRLTRRDWFFDGKRPTQFDATIYARLAIMYSMQLQNNDLKSHINECPSLVKFMKIVRTKYLAELKVANESKSVAGSVKNVFVDRESGSMSNATFKVIAAVVAISSMVLFAWTHGILEIGMDDDGLSDPTYSPYEDDDDGYGDE